MDLTGLIFGVFLGVAETNISSLLCCGLCCVFLKIIDLVIAPVRVQHQETTNTVKPLLTGPPIKRTLSRVPKLTSYISLYNEPLFRGHLC